MTGSAPTNSQAVDFEKQQAAEADAKEAARQQRLTQGQTLIDQIFSGSPVMATTSTPFDWSKFKPTTNTAMAAWEAANPSAATAGMDTTTGANAPAGYKAVRVAPRNSGKSTGSTVAGLSALDPTIGKQSTGYGDWSTLDPTLGKKSTGYGDWSTLDPTLGKGAGSGASGGGSVWALQGPDGKIYYQGDPLSVTTQTDTGKKSGGFDDDFYNNYRQKVLDYYNPDEERQYSEAKRDLTYNLARAGTLQSSTAGDKQGELAYNDALQKANIVANANTQTGNLKNQIQANKESLINQLYATEDPTLTANLAESSAAASRLQDPNLTPMAALFTPALSAVGAVGNYATSPYSLYGAGGSGSGASSPAVRPADKSSGQLSGGGYG